MATRAGMARNARLLRKNYKNAVVKSYLKASRTGPLQDHTGRRNTAAAYLLDSRSMASKGKHKSPFG